MIRYTLLLAIAMAFLAATGAACADEKADELKKSVELGELDAHFELASAERSVDPERGDTLVLKLKAKRDMDTSQLFYKAGFFDKDGHMHLASPVRFDAGFPLKKGESMRVEVWEGRDPQNWQKISLRKVNRPVSRSEYHYQ
jgi:hypothetical protein